MNNHSEETQEIICANCGRPNLPEAVRCWYCQIELGSADENAASEVEEEAPAPQTLDQALPSPDPQQEAQQEEDIPEWLRRIREKEQKERASQAARDQWQQQALFNGGSKSARPAPEPAPAENPAHKPAARPAPAVHEEHEEVEASQPALDSEPPAPEQEPAQEPDQEPVLEAEPQQPQPPQPPAQKPAVIIEEEEDDDDDENDEELPPDASSEDLPDGFIKFDSNDN